MRQIIVDPEHSNKPLMENVMGDDFLYPFSMKARLDAGIIKIRMEQIKILNSTLARLWKEDLIELNGMNGILINN